MKKLLIISLLIFSSQASADLTVKNLNYFQANLLAQKYVQQLLDSNSEGEISLNRSYRLITDTDRLIYISRVTLGYSSEGRYQRAYQYLCRQSKQHYLRGSLRASFCGELDYQMRLKRG